MQARLVSFGLIEVDGTRFEHDVVLDRGSISKRRKRGRSPFETATGTRR